MTSTREKHLWSNCWCVIFLDPPLLNAMRSFEENASFSLIQHSRRAAVEVPGADWMLLVTRADEWGFSVNHLLLELLHWKGTRQELLYHQQNKRGIEQVKRQEIGRSQSEVGCGFVDCISASAHIFTLFSRKKHIFLTFLCEEATKGVIPYLTVAHA